MRLAGRWVKVGGGGDDDGGSELVKYVTYMHKSAKMEPANAHYQYALIKNMGTKEL